jgi:hypothetical protein
MQVLSDNKYVAGYTSGSLATDASGSGTAFSCAGYGRVKYLINLGGAPANGTSGSTSVNITQSATTGGTFTTISTGSIVSKTTGIHLIDVPVNPSYPAHKVTATPTAGSSVVSVTAELYGAVNSPATQSNTETVV